MGRPSSSTSMKTVLPSSFLLFSSILFFLSHHVSSSPEYQHLVVNTLPNPPSLHTDPSEWTEVEEPLSSSPSTDSSFTVPLHHIDAFTATSETTADDLFSHRLKRDALRVESIHSLVAEAASSATPLRGHHHHHRGKGFVRRNATRSHGRGFSSSVTSGLKQGSGEYFTRLGVGSPPKNMYMVLDTGSDVVWIQCMPCQKCYTQTDPVFDPKRSTSFASIPCGSPLCHSLDQPGCTRRTNKCAYEVSYGDGSFTVGEFARETMTFRRTAVPNVALGCGHDNEGLFVGAAGLLGLGRGKLSFPTQAGRRFGRTFSYCLVDRSTSSKPSSVIFGTSAISRAASYTPLLSNPKLDTFYYIEMVGISVGGSRVHGISGELFKFDNTGNGGVIVDSGTSVTRLTRPAYIALRDAFRAGATGLKPAEGFSLFDTCYDLSGKTEVKVPTVVMHFKGADVSLPANNYLIPVDTSGRFCFAFAGTMGGLSIIGNIQQQGFRVVFDEASRRVGFLGGACS